MTEQAQNPREIVGLDWLKNSTLPYALIPAFHNFQAGKLNDEQFAAVFMRIKDSSVESGFEAPFGSSKGWPKNINDKQLDRETEKFLNQNITDFEAEVDQCLEEIMLHEDPFITRTIIFLEKFLKKSRALSPLTEMQKKVMRGSYLHSNLNPHQRFLYQNQGERLFPHQSGYQVVGRINRLVEFSEAVGNDKSRIEVDSKKNVQNYLTQSLEEFIEICRQYNPQLSEEFSQMTEDLKPETSLLLIMNYISKFGNFPQDRNLAIKIHGRAKIIHSIMFFNEELKEGKLTPITYDDITQSLELLKTNPDSYYFGKIKSEQYGHNSPLSLYALAFKFPQFFLQWQFLNGRINRDFVDRYFPEVFGEDKNSINFQIQRHFDRIKPNSFLEIFDSQKFHTPTSQELINNFSLPKIEINGDSAVISDINGIAFAPPQELIDFQFSENQNQRFSVTGKTVCELDTTVPLPVGTIKIDNNPRYLCSLPQIDISKYIAQWLPENILLNGSVLNPEFYQIKYTNSGYPVLVFNIDLPPDLVEELKTGITLKNVNFYKKESSEEGLPDIFSAEIQKKDLSQLVEILEKLQIENVKAIFPELVDSKFTESNTKLNLKTVLLRLENLLIYRNPSNVSQMKTIDDDLSIAQKAYGRHSSDTPDIQLYKNLRSIIIGLHRGKALVTCYEAAEICKYVSHFLTHGQSEDFLYKSHIFPRQGFYDHKIPRTRAVFGGSHTDWRNKFTNEVIDITPEAQLTPSEQSEISLQAQYYINTTN